MGSCCSVDWSSDYEPIIVSSLDEEYNDEYYIYNDINEPYETKETRECYLV